MLAYPKGYTLIFLYIRRLIPYLGVHNFVFNIILVFRKNEYFFGMMKMLDILGEYSQNWTFFFFFFWGGGVISIHFRAFA